MVYRHQVSLLMTDKDTSDFVDSLKKEKRLKTQIVKFLEVYQENPQQTELWLENRGNTEGSGLEESEKLVNLKSSLEIFKTFVDTAREQNESNVDSYTDYLTNDEYIRFRTEFEKSEQYVKELDQNELSSTVGTSTGSNILEKDVEDLKNDVKELKSLVKQAVSQNSQIVSEVKTEATTTSSDDLLDLSKLREEKEEIAGETDTLVEQELEYVDSEEVSFEGDEEGNSNDTNISDALDVMAGLNLV